MTTKTDNSYGIVPIRRIGQEWQVLLIDQFSRIGNNTYWALPKGHAEIGETPLQAAKRELCEETGLVPQTLLETPTFDLHYSFFVGEDQIEKAVLFYIGIIAPDDQVVIDPEEVREAGWFTLDDALEQLNYKDTKELFMKVHEYILRHLR